MALITRSFVSFGTTVEVSYTFDDVSLDLVSVTLRNDDTRPASCRLTHPVLGIVNLAIPQGPVRTIAVPPVLNPAKQMLLVPPRGARPAGLAFPFGFEFTGPS